MTAALTFVVSVLVLVVFASVSANQNGDLASLLSRMNSVEGKVASLNNRVASLESRLSQSGGENPEPEPTDFKIVNVTRAEDRASSKVTFTLQYDAQEEPQFLMAPNSWTLPMEISHDSGSVTFSVPSDEVSPMLYVRTQSNLFYSLTLLNDAGGPPPAKPEQFPNVIISTSPAKSVKFQEGHEAEAEITITTHVTGTRSQRQVRKERLEYYVYALNDNVVDAFPYVTLYDENLGDSHASANNNDDNVNNNDQHRRLRLVEHERDGKQTTDVVKLDGSRENSGVLFVVKSFEFSCQACVLYGVSVSKPLPYYLDNGEYVLPEGSLVAYKDIYNFGPDRKGPHYFRFLRVNELEAAHVSHQTCQRGQPCSLQCTAFGDYPEVNLFLFNRAVTTEGVYYDQVGNKLTGPQARDSAKIKGWSAQVGMEAYSYIHFDDVRPEHAGRYECQAWNNQMQMFLMRTFILTVE